MSLAASMWAWQQRIPNPRHKLLLLKLADSANDGGFCWPYVKTLASDLDMSKSAITRATRALEEAGLLTIRERYRTDGSQGANMYLLHVNGEVPSLEGEGVTSDRGGFHSRDRESLHSSDVPRTVKEPSVEPRSKPPAAVAAAQPEHIANRSWKVASTRQGKGPFVVDLESETCNCENRQPTPCRHMRAAVIAEERRDKARQRELRDALWDALVELFGPVAERTRKQRGAAVSSLRELLIAEEIPDADHGWDNEVKHRHGALSKEWGLGRVTLEGFVRNFGIAGKLTNGNGSQHATAKEDVFTQYGEGDWLVHTPGAMCERDNGRPRESPP